MDGPGAGFAGCLDLVGEISEMMDESILFAPIAHPKSQMMRERGQIDFEIDGERLRARGHRLKRSARPEGTRAGHAQDRPAILPGGNRFPVRMEARIGGVVEVVRV